jgi:hypothetical protein
MVKPPFRLNVSVNSLLFLRDRVKILLVFLAMVLLASSTTRAQEGLPSAPEAKPRAREIKTPMWALVSANAANFGSTFFMAQAIRRGSSDCVIEAGRRGESAAGWNPNAAYHRALLIGGALDAGVFLASWKLRRSHPGVATWLPVVSAAATFGVGGSQYNSGCS